MDISVFPSWELTYPLPFGTIESMIFLFPRWDLLSSLETIYLFNFHPEKNAKHTQTRISTSPAEILRLCLRSSWLVITSAWAFLPVLYISETKIAPENGWLEYDRFLLEWHPFRCELLVSGRVDLWSFKIARISTRWASYPFCIWCEITPESGISRVIVYMGTGL